MGIVRGLLTLALMAAFIALVVWLFVFRKPGDFDEAASLALEEDGKGDNDDE